MKLLFRQWIFLSVITTCHAAITPAEFNERFKILPIPQKIELSSGRGLRHTEVLTVSFKDTGYRPVMTSLLADLPQGIPDAPGSVTLSLNASLNLPSPEGYALEVANGKVSIEATTPAGLFYGIQTLTQLLEDAQDQQIEIPACRITDYPEIAYRAVHLDLKHHLDAGHYYYSVIDRLAAIKVNAIIIEFEDKLRYRKAPLVGAPQAISIEEFAAISKYAKERFIEISPLIQGLGHASFILKHDAYKALRDDPASDWVFDAMNPATYDLQFALYEDAIAATPYGKYLHVGGDEVGTLGKSPLAVASGKTALELQMYWLTKVTEFARQRNRIPIFWDDMVFKLAHLYETTYSADMPAAEVAQRWQTNGKLLDESLQLFPQQCAYMRWNYDDPAIPGNQRAIDWYKSHNLTVMAATSAQPYYSTFPRARTQFQPIKDFCKITSEKKMSGILCTIWDDTSPHFETLWRGIGNFALFSWNYEDVPMDRAHTIFKQRFYSAAVAEPAYSFQDVLEEHTGFWETAFLKTGNREVYPEKIDLIDLPDKKNKGTWSKAYATKLTQAKANIKAHADVTAQLTKAEQITRRGHYALSLFGVINELEAYASQLLVALEDYDKAAKKDQPQQAARVKKQVDDFTALRARFEETYAKTRIMGNPEGYQLDSNFHHHLANGTNTTDWLFIYELAINQKIKDWLSQP